MVKDLEIAAVAKPTMDSRKSDDAADFEKAIMATGYGKFNYLLLLLAAPGCFACVFDTTVMSFVLPSAECDLNLSLLDKGVLNAVTYGGMISSAILWGFLSDILGRRKLLIYGYLMDAIVNILCALSQNFTAIIIFKFIGGFIISGPFAVLMSYLSEFHGLEYRSRVMMTLGIFYSLAGICLPGLAWLVIPLSWNLTIIENLFQLHTWQLFILVCSLPSLIAGIGMIFMPESPKFLMSRGRNPEALKVFEFIYHLNSNQSTGNFPIKGLINEKEMNAVKEKILSKSKSKALNGLRNGLSQMSVMLDKPNLKNGCLVYSIQFCILFGLNSLRLWVPQIFTIITEYTNDLAARVNGAGSFNTNLCGMIEYKVNKTQQTLNSLMDDVDTICEPTLKSDMYLNSLIIGVIGLFGYFFASSLINKIGNKNMLIFGLIISGACGISLYWSSTSLNTLMLSSGYIVIASICSTALISCVVNLFPTATRTMNVSLTMMFGRSGALIGNLLFPLLMSYGCIGPFLMIGVPSLVCSLICTMLPRTIKRPLQ